MAYKKLKELDSKLFLIYPSLEEDDKYKDNKYSKFVVGTDEDYPLWAFSLPVFNILGSKSNECLIIFDDNEEQRCWREIKKKLDAITKFQ